MTGDVRILKGWTEKERKELEEAKDNGFPSAVDLINGIVNDDDDCIALTGKYMDESSDEDNQLARDIVDYYTGAAKFPDKKYYVHFAKGYKNGYLNVHKDTGEIFISARTGIDNNVFKTAFTDEEIKAIDPRYMAFVVPVEE